MVLEQRVVVGHGGILLWLRDVGGLGRHAVSAFLGHANVTTTAQYLIVNDDDLHELIERKPLALVR